ncbi:threonine/serine dehydratase [Cryptosporangium aurantiacum]|uniref:L-threonine ammonia-lyase n=1 Tax=Cryptosporangium aurantiacum TaxID=134849 RepID=A0A1M7KFE3_9ACTN|nr:threonine/serine dehydratase [Cryptosporangium aurantiacum]SHM63932.1 L-threonine ammonia-lyase [Cryptosporangium aurantiacum]
MTENLVDLPAIEAAARLIEGDVVRTPTVPSTGLSELLGVPVTAKLELLQRTGSFKVRGAAAKLRLLDDAERVAGVVAVSGGNHGIAVAAMADSLGVKATIVMPRSAPRRAVELAERHGATVQLTTDVTEAFALGGRLRAEGLTLIHPFDDPDVVAGQGTVGRELAQDAGALTDVLVSIGGGGLISGIAAAIRALRPGVRIWGVETAGSDAMARALAAGGPIPIVPTSIVTTLSPPAVAPLTYAHVRALVDDVLVVTDAEAVRGTLEIAEAAKVWTEPAAGCLLPAARRVVEQAGGDCRLGLVLCGGNATVADVLAWASRFGVDVS